MSIRKELIVAAAAVASVFLMAFNGSYPFEILMDWGARIKSQQAVDAGVGKYEMYHSASKDQKLLIDVKSGIHFWHPQVVVWIEDTLGQFVKTLFITESTAKGLFLSGRNANNFKSFDANKKVKTLSSENLRLVDALPFWSHKRGKETLPNFFAPVFSDPEVDGMTGATPQGNFYIRSQVPEELSTFNLWLEVNVAFDDNKFYSEYDFPDDSSYHGGTGLLGQPSLIYKATLQRSEQQGFRLMDLMGHSHHSGQNGNLYNDLSSITTAKRILDRVVVGWE